TLVAALSTARSCHSPLAGAPLNRVRASLGLKLPTNGAVPVEIEVFAAPSNVVVFEQLEPKLLPAPPTRAASLTSWPPGLTRTRSRSESCAWVMETETVTFDTPPFRPVSVTGDVPTPGPPDSSTPSAIATGP